jgi:nitrite reductase/ring-hydroxylating ferredoxin subunit
MTFIAVAKSGDVEQGKSICVQVARKRIALFNVEGNFYALDDYCPHKGAPLVDGYLSATEVTCPWHGASFELATGKGLLGPCGGGIESYPVRIIGDDIELDV